MRAHRFIGCGVSALLVFAAFVSASTAATVDELRQILSGGQRVVLIDIRSRVRFVNGHIPGAMNIPAKVISMKRLPRLGRVIVYGDGVHTPVTMEAVADLDAMPGINAEILIGGYAAWSGGGRQSTETAGRHELVRTYLSLTDLKAIAEVEPNLVLVDLRVAGTLPDLSTEFPGTMIIEDHATVQEGAQRAKVRVSAFLRGGKPDNEKLFVLVDDGDGRADEVAMRLRAAGVKRTAILAGGQIGLKAGEEPATNTVVTQ